jgi:tRNA(His) 5'-end guanylyltransferase
MALTAHDLLKEFLPSSVFTFSDEITMVFPRQDIQENTAHVFAGRTAKLASCTAAYASVRFNNHLAKQDYSQSPQVVSKSQFA